MTNRNEDQYARIPLSDIATPVHNYVAKVNQWWLVDDDHALVWKPTNSYQCSDNKEIIDCIRHDRNLDVVFVPLAFVPPRQGF